MSDHSIKFSIEDKKFQRDIEKLMKKHSKKLYEAVVDSSNKMATIAKQGVPVDTGYLRGHITTEISKMGIFTGEVVSGADYSQAVEEGTKPHPIEVKNKKVLAGKGSGPGGWDIFGTKVKHPGTKPQPFMRPAFMKAKNHLEKLIKRII